MTPAVLRRGRLRAPRWNVIAVALAFGLLFAWELFGAISNLVAWLTLAALTRAQLTALLWLILGADLAIPVVSYAGTLWLGRRRTPGTIALMLLLAYCVSQALTLSVYAFFEGVVSTSG